MPRYIGRFAPSPTGALHAGSLVAALASWLDARAHGGQWLVRIEDIDTPRCMPAAAEEILRQLAACGLIPDESPVFQSQRGHLYQAALDRLIESQAAYPCACSRKDIEAVWQARGVHKAAHEELIYPGTCRISLQGREARTWRFLTDFLKPKQQIAGMEYAQNAIDLIVNNHSTVHWQDRRLGSQEQDVSSEVGDFVLRRADGLWAYQLAVVVDDAAQGITHIVRGEDLADNTPRQILLQRALGLPTPQYLHTPLVLAHDGQKLSKQNNAQAINVSNANAVKKTLSQAARTLGLEPADELSHDPISHLFNNWRQQWTKRLS
jgi:glutamyl-Q tRNA(Asp) synthetase